MTGQPASHRRRVLVFGPPYGQFIARGAGGGTGGYTRNMEVYLHHLGSDDFQLFPVFHTVRGQDSGFKALFPVRLAREFARMALALVRHRPDVVHCLGRYREAIPREAMLAALCRAFRVPLVYDIKGRAFVDAYRDNGPAYRFLVDRVVASAAALLAEGQIYQPFVHDQFGREATFFPNFVPDEEVPGAVPERLAGETLRVLFVGFCHPDKGVHEVVDGCRQLAARGVAVHLTLIGAETPEFAAYVDNLAPLPGFACERLGRREHAEVRAAMLAHDVFCFPSKGEGHSNAITEAMMSGMVIACSRVGFLEAVVEERGGFFLDGLSAQAVATALERIHRDPNEARRRASFAHGKVRREFTASTARNRIAPVYRQILSAC